MEKDKMQISNRIMLVFKKIKNRNYEKYKQSQRYFQKTPKEQLLSEYLFLKASIQSYAKSWEILLGLFATIIFSSDLKDIFSFLFHIYTNLPLDTIKDSILPSFVILLLICIQLIAVFVMKFKYVISLKKYNLLESYLKKNKII